MPLIGELKLKQHSLSVGCKPSGEVFAKARPAYNCSLFVQTQISAAPASLEVVVTDKTVDDNGNEVTSTSTLTLIRSEDVVLGKLVPPIEIWGKAGALYEFRLSYPDGLPEVGLWALVREDRRGRQRE